MISLSVFDHFAGLLRKGLRKMHFYKNEGSIPCFLKHQLDIAISLLIP